MNRAQAETVTNPRPRMSVRNRVLFFVTAWLIVLMPFLFWWNTWFGRQLSDKHMAEYLQDEKHPRHIQHALVQLGERIENRAMGVERWYPDIVRLATHPVEEVRNTDAWVMGQNPSVASFHSALLKMLNDASPTVRGNAALSLVRFGDSTGKSQIVALLQPITITSPQAGKIVDTAVVGRAIHQDGAIAKLEQDGRVLEIRSSVGGRLKTMSVQVGQQINAGTAVAIIDPSSEQLWEALRALYLIGAPEDIPAIAPYERELPDIPDHIREQAIATEKAIRERAAK